MADQASTVAKINVFGAEVQAIGVVVPPGSGVFANLAPNTARNLGTYRAVGDPDWEAKSQSITDDGGCAFHQGRHLFTLFGGSHGWMQGNMLRLLDTLTGTWNAWNQPYASTRWAAMVATNLDPIGRWIGDNLPVTRHTYSHMVWRGDELFIMQSYCNPDNIPPGSLPSFHAKFAIYNIATNTWRYSTKQMPWFHASASVLDPVSQNIYTVGLTGTVGPALIWKYDPVADAITTGPRMFTDSQPVDLVYCPDDDKFYSFQTGGIVRRITVDRANIANCTSVLLATTGPKPLQDPVQMAPTGRPRGYPSFTWDSVNHRMGGCFIDGIHYEFDPATSAWTATTLLVESGSTGGSPVSQDFSCSAFDEGEGVYIAVQIAVSGGPRTWTVRP